MEHAKLAATFQKNKSPSTQALLSNSDLSSDESNYLAYYNDSGSESDEFDDFTSDSASTSSADERGYGDLEDLRIAGVTDGIHLFPQTLEGQDLAKDILKAVDEGNVAEVKGLLQQPGIVVNGTNKV